MSKKYIGKMNLCKPCAVAMEEDHKVRMVRRGKDEKVECEKCKRMRFGAEYFVEPK